MWLMPDVLHPCCKFATYATAINSFDYKIDKKLFSRSSNLSYSTKTLEGHILYRVMK